MIHPDTIRSMGQEVLDRAADHRKALARKQSEIDSLRRALKSIADDIKPEILDSEIELIAWWGRQVSRLQAIAKAELYLPWRDGAV